MYAGGRMHSSTVEEGAKKIDDIAEPKEEV